MPNGSVLELASLAERHPDLALLYPHGMMAVIRLSLDPAPSMALSPEAFQRSIVVNHCTSLTAPENEFEQVLGWQGLGITDVIRTGIENTYNENVITEFAAIAVMGLLVHELEAVQVTKVLQVGNGGDYIAKVLKSGEVIQVEGSGIKDDYPSESRTRLERKKRQVQTAGVNAFVSVTTFHQRHREGGIVHSFLHFVESAAPPVQPKSKSRRKSR